MSRPVPERSRCIGVFVLVALLMCLVLPAFAAKREVASVRIHLPKKATAVTKRAAEILADRIEEYCGARVLTSGRAQLNVYLGIKPGIGREGFKISGEQDGSIRITGNDERGVLYGVGKFLRTSNYSSRGFTPGLWRGISVPAMPFRGLYFATHFHNYYEDAPMAEVTRYMEDLSLWGANALWVYFDTNDYSGINDPKAQVTLTRLRALLRVAKDLGLSTCTSIVANEYYANSPVELRAETNTEQNGYSPYLGMKAIANLGGEVCPNKPGVKEMLVKACEEKFAAFKSVGLDYWLIWPYDSGGCTCAKCAPWGANGYLMAAELQARAYRRHFPNGKVVLSTWLFDLWTKGEWAGMAEKFKKQKPDWVDYLMVDGFTGSFPEYPLKHGSPAGLPILNFTEISMYQHSPYGGYGANPLPKYVQKLWDESKSKLSGGFPYSEGVYEDINKAICQQLYWDPDKPADQTLKEYISFYFSQSVVDDVSRAMYILERNMARTRTDVDGITKFTLKSTEGAEEAYRLITEAEAKLPARPRTSWRWRIVYLRALIDWELVRHEFRVSAKCAEAFKELTTIYHAEKGWWNVHPPKDLLGVLPAGQ